MKHSDLLRNRYKDEILNWDIDWDNFKPEYISTDECGDVVGRTFIGSVQLLWPSGKIYAPWTTNQTARDVLMDGWFNEALDEVMDETGLSINCDNGDVFVEECIGPAEESYITYDGGDTFKYGGETYKADEIEANMEAEGYYPDIFEGNEELTYYVID